MQKQIAATMERHGMPGRGGRIGVAVSGGADSVFLLHTLANAGLAVAVLHVNHKLRGAESDRDELFVRHLAGQFGLPIHVAALPPGAGNVEQEARRGRYSFFEECIAAGRCDSVATGHTRDDQAETVLSRFLRGAGTAGLSGIRPVTQTGIVRPLLDLGRLDIRDWLRSHDVAWQEDCSNQDTAFLRNRIRHEIMPQLSTINPSLPAVLASFAAWAQGEEDYWQGELRRFESEHLVRDRDAVLVRTGPLRALPVAAERRMIRQMVERVRGSLRSIDFRHVEAIRDLVAATEGSGRLQLPDLDVYRSFDWLRMAPLGFDSRPERDFEIPLKVPGITSLPERGIVVQAELSTAGPVYYRAEVYNDEVNALDWEKCAGALVLRNWRPGDRYLPVGRTAAEKIKTLFQESRVPLWERRNWPVIVQSGACEDSIVWARRFGAAGPFAAGTGSKQILFLRETIESNITSGTSIEAEGSDPDESLVSGRARVW